MINHWNQEYLNVTVCKEGEEKKRIKAIILLLYLYDCHLKNGPFSENTLYYSPCFFEKMAPKSPPIFITFSDTY